jgi:hypothetical protein
MTAPPRSAFPECHRIRKPLAQAVAPDRGATLNILGSVVTVLEAGTRIIGRA